MNKFRAEDRKYFNIATTAYIGAGNNLLVFTRRAKPSFSKIKQIYGEHLENSVHTQTPIKNEKKLSAELKLKIREEIRKETIRGIRNQILAIFISLIIFAILIFGAMKLIYLLFPTLKT